MPLCRTCSYALRHVRGADWKEEEQRACIVREHKKSAPGIKAKGGLCTETGRIYSEGEKEKAASARERNPRKNRVCTPCITLCDAGHRNLRVTKSASSRKSYNKYSIKWIFCEGESKILQFRGSYPYWRESRVRGARDFPGEPCEIPAENGKHPLLRRVFVQRPASFSTRCIMARM